MVDVVSELLSKAGPEPLYRRVVQYLKDRIADGTYPPATMLPSEMELVAALGVSRPTVRRAIDMLIDEGLVERVVGRGTYVCEARGGVRPGRTGNVGLVVLEIRDDFVLRILTGAEHALAERGFRPVLASSRNEIGVEQAKIRDMWEDGAVDGFLIMPADSPEPHRVLTELAAQGIPLVLMDRYFEELDAPSVTSDDLTGGRLVTEHLLGLGHRRIGFVTRPNLYVSSMAQRLRGYKQALEGAGVPYDPSLVFQGLLPYISEMHVHEQASARLAQFERDALREYLSRPDRPSAVFACNDTVAVRIVEVCREMGLRIPEDLALVGYSDDPIASILTPPLTTVRQNPYEMGARAAHILLDMLDGKPVQRRTFLPVELVVKESSESSR